MLLWAFGRSKLKSFPGSRASLLHEDVTITFGENKQDIQNLLRKQRVCGNGLSMEAQ